MAGRLEGKVAVVSGGARGQGAAHARRLAEEGAAVIAGDVLDAEGQACAAALRADGLAVDFLHLDVTQPDDWSRVVATATERLGGVDVLVNNAGHGYLSAVEEGEDVEVRKLFDVNYFGAVDMIKAVLPAMRARGAGHIVNISSMTGLVANPPNAYYSSTKFALEAVTEALAT